MGEIATTSKEEQQEDENVEFMIKTEVNSCSKVADVLGLRSLVQESGSGCASFGGETESGRRKGEREKYWEKEVGVNKEETYRAWMAKDHTHKKARRQTKDSM